MRRLLATLAALCLATAAHAGPGRIVVLTSGTSWTVPADFTASNTVELIGAGAGGGGAYAKKNNMALTPGATVTFQIGSGANAGGVGGDTWFGSSSTVKAAGANTTTGGLAASSIGDTVFSGGNAVTGAGNHPGGGAAGLHGAGQNGVNNVSGGAGDAGFGGAGGLSQSGGSPGGAGAEWGLAGSGGGAGQDISTNCSSTCKGGLYGGGAATGPGGALGANGVIVIQYVPRGRVSSGAF